MVQLVDDGKQIAGSIKIDGDKIGNMMPFGRALFSASEEEWIGVHNGRIRRLWCRCRVNPMVDLQKRACVAAAIGAA